LRGFATHIKNLKARNEARPFIQNWAPERMLKMTTCIGSQMSTFVSEGQLRLEQSSCDVQKDVREVPREMRDG